MGIQFIGNVLERKIAVYDKQNFKKKLIEFTKVAKECMQNDLNEENIYEILYTTELFRNSIYKCLKFKMPSILESSRKQDEISKFESEYSDGILKIKIYELLPPVRTPYNNRRLEKTCQTVAEKYKGLFENKEVIIRVQVSMPRDNWDIDNRDLRYIFNGFVYGKLITDDNIKFVSYMLEGINDKENYIKIFVSEKSNIKNVSIYIS